MIRNRQISAAAGRLLAFLLALTMVFSLALESSALTMEQPSEETEQQIDSLEETAPETEEPPAGTGETEQQTEPEAAPETGAEIPVYPEGEETPDPSEPEAEPSETDPENPDSETPEQPLPEESAEAAQLPEEAVDWRKQRVISRVALYYLRRFGYGEETPVRFDVVALFGEQDFSVSLYQNAFEFC